MPYTRLSGVRLASVYSAVPANEIRIEDELKYYGNSLKKADRARKMIGTDRRRVAVPGTLTTADLCKAAAERLLHDGNVDRSSIDALIFVTQSPDYILPATACLLQDQMGLSHSCATFDVNQGCSGYVYGLWLAASLISSGSCRNVLLLAGDVNEVPRNPDNRITTPIFGDGGSATLLTYDESAPEMTFSLGTDGAGYKHIIVPVGRARIPYSQNFEENRLIFKDVVTESGTPWRLNEVYMDGAEVFNFTLNVIPSHLQEFMKYNSLGPEDVDWLFLHQANKQIVETVASKAGFPLEKAPHGTFSRYGNLSSASIPAVLCDTFGENRNSGEKVLLLCGYGVGLSWASCLVKTHGIACAPVMDITPANDIPNRQQQLEYWQEKLSGGTRQEN